MNPMPARTETPNKSIQRTPGPQVGLRQLDGEPGGAENADRLAQQQAGDDSQRDRIAERVEERLVATQCDTGGEEREDRYRESGRQRPESVLELPRQSVVPVDVAATEDQDGEAEEHSGDGRVDSRGVDEPQVMRPREEHGPRRPVVAGEPVSVAVGEEGEQRQRNQREEQGSGADVLGVHDGDDDDGDRSSTTARVSRNNRNDAGRRDPTTARTATANAMSVAVGSPSRPRRDRRG